MLRCVSVIPKQKQLSDLVYPRRDTILLACLHPDKYSSSTFPFTSYLGSVHLRLDSAIIIVRTTSVKSAICLEPSTYRAYFIFFLCLVCSQLCNFISLFCHIISVCIYKCHLHVSRLLLFAQKRTTLFTRSF